ncbi:MAG: LuxR C-terminal-related transcriptional regulator [Mycobacteriales bacterium]|nr:response regulator transcription factor [Frankia sp.]
MEPGAALLDEGLAAVRAGRWAEGAAALEGVIADLPESSPELPDALDALADARWWLNDAAAAATAREAVYRLTRERGERSRAARAAAWLAREYAAALGNPPLGRGWLSRAIGLLQSDADASAHGWVALARATLADTADEQREQATVALDAAREVEDADLELLALSRLGLAHVSAGDMRTGLARFDEAMAAATAGDATNVTTEAQLCCDLVVAAELSGDQAWFGRWVETVNEVADARGQPSPASFCTTCTAENSAAHGDYEGAEQKLHVAVVDLDRTGWRSRCVPPGVKLAELYVNWGRLEEAEQALGAVDDEAALLVRARIALARGEPSVAATLADRAVRRLGPRDPRLVAFLVVVVDAHVAAGQLEAATAASESLGVLADQLDDPRTHAQAAVARGRTAAAAGAAEPACLAFEHALDHVSGLTCIEAGLASLELAKLRAAERPEVARVDARAALRHFDAIGVQRLSDEAAALLRTLGDHSRVGVKDAGTLSNREQEVLRLLAQGLTNREIAGRLFISTKTAGNHVSAILTKLGLRSRTEAAAFALQQSMSE